jgi:hypothetical protein
VTFWAYREQRRDLLHTEPARQQMESALRRGEADAYDFLSTDFVEFDEHEDEGACYAFQLAGERVAFLCGQEFYPRARFPSLDFSLVYPLDETGEAVDMYIEKRGPRARPVRRLSSDDRQRLEVFTSLEVRDGRVDDL